MGEGEACRVGPRSLGSSGSLVALRNRLLARSSGSSELFLHIYVYIIFIHNFKNNFTYNYLYSCIALCIHVYIFLYKLPLVLSIYFTYTYICNYTYICICNFVYILIYNFKHIITNNFICNYACILYSYIYI